MLNEVGEQARKAFLIYNNNDSCYFMKPAASDFKARISDLEFYA